MPNEKGKVKKVEKITKANVKSVKPMFPGIKVQRGTQNTNSGSETYKVTSIPVPAGNPVPVRIPSGKKILSISNPFNGTGQVIFELGVLPYSPGVVDLGSVYDFPGVGEVEYHFTNIPKPGTEAKIVFLNIDDFC